MEMPTYRELTNFIPVSELFDGDVINIVPKGKPVAVEPCIKVFRVKQYNSTYKSILMLNGEPVMISRSEKRINEALQFINGDKTALQHDKALQRSLMKYIQKGK